MNGIEYQLITRADELPALLELFSHASAVGLDSETTGLDPHTSKIRLLQFSFPGRNILLDVFELPSDSLKPVFSFLENPALTKVAHNAKFDAKFLRSNFGVDLNGIFDTYLSSVLVGAGSEIDRHSLEASVQRLLSISMNKEAQLSDWSGHLDKYQLEYAAHDSEVLLPLRDALAEKLNEMDLNVIAELEHECLPSIIDMEFRGVYLDQQRWTDRISIVRRECDAVSLSLKEELGRASSQMSLFDSGMSVNLDSPHQVRDALLRLGIDVDSTSEWHLTRMAGDHPIVARLLTYRSLSKSLSSFGEGLLEFVNPSTKRIHADFRQIGTPTGRITCSSPSLQQIPHGIEYRSCFRAPEGRRLVVADFSQIEMRILAELSNDDALLKAFRLREDLHRSTAAQMYGIPLTHVTPHLREKAKGLNYGLVYGMGAEGLAARLGITVEEAGALIDRYFAAYPGVDRWLRRAADLAIDEGRARTASGRLWVFNLDPLNREEHGQLRRVGKNAPIQGTGSDIFKRAMTITSNRLKGSDAFIVNSIHDEIVVECDQATADETAKIVNQSMIDAGSEFLFRVPIEVDVSVTDCWE